MADMTNEAAERLRAAKRSWLLPSEPWDRLIDEALAAERRATVERIRAALEASPDEDWHCGCGPDWKLLLTFLDAEANR